jgi:hypothetical protein
MKGAEPEHELVDVVHRRRLLQVAAVRVPGGQPSRPIVVLEAARPQGEGMA